MTVQLAVCWFFIFTGRCEPVAISDPLPLEQCLRIEQRNRHRKPKLLGVFCI
jgi:hypothetical protein